MAFRPVDGEIVDARWLTPAELAARRPGPPDSLNRWLLRSWLVAS
jgi:hypothetical protein